MIGKVVLGLAALPALAACDAAPPAPQDTGISAEEQAAQAEAEAAAKAKADREAKLASFYGGQPEDNASDAAEVDQAQDAPAADNPPMAQPAAPMPAPDRPIAQPLRPSAPTNAPQ